jgi:hypothetical protein
LLELAAVGLIIRSRKLPPLGAALAVEARDSGRLGALGATEARGGLALAALDAGRVVVDGLRVTFASSPCLAAEAAVGAVKRAGKPTGRVGDFGRGFLNPVGEVLRQY